MLETAELMFDEEGLVLVVVVTLEGEEGEE